MLDLQRTLLASVWATTLRPVPALSTYRIVLMTLTDLEPTGICAKLQRNSI